MSQYTLINHPRSLIECYIGQQKSRIKLEEDEGYLTQMMVPINYQRKETTIYLICTQSTEILKMLLKIKSRTSLTIILLYFKFILKVGQLQEGIINQYWIICSLNIGAGIQRFNIKINCNYMLSMHQQLSYFELDTNSEHDLFFPLPQFPVHPFKHYDNKLIDQINILVTSHHSPTLIQLQDQIHFHDTQQYLRRYYRQHEQNKKIGLLGEYYRYHFQAPRLFMTETVRIIQENVDEKRMLEYALVTNQLNQQKKSTIATVATARVTPVNKIIQDVELSYTNFEQKQKKADQRKTERKSKGQQNKPPSNLKTIKFKSSVPTEQSKQKMKRTSSINSKGSFFNFKNKPKQTNTRKTDQYKKPKLPSRKTNADRPNQNLRTQLTKTKKNSVNSSIVSNQKKSLSRSQSRTQLTVFESKKLPSKTNIVRNNPVLKSSASQSNFSNKMSVKSMKNSINSQYNSTNSSQHKKQRTHLKNNEQKVNRVAYNTIDANKSRDTQNTPIPVSKVKNKGKESDCDKVPTKDSKKGLMFGKAIQLRKNR